MTWNIFNLIDRNRIENGKVPIHSNRFETCENCKAVSREYKKLRDECERLFEENQKLKEASK